MKKNDIALLLIIVATVCGVGWFLLRDHAPQAKPTPVAEAPREAAAPASPVSAEPRQAKPQITADPASSPPARQAPIAKPEAAPPPSATPAPTEPKVRSPRQIIVGSWDSREGNVTFNADGTFQVFELAGHGNSTISGRYTWDSDDHMTWAVTEVRSSGESHEESFGVTVVSMTENEMVCRNDRDGDELTFTR